MLRKVLLVMGGTLASRVLGLLRQAVFNALFPDALKDAFNVAYRVPNLLRELLAEGAVQNALIPLLKALPEEEARVFARRFAAFLLGVNLLVLGLGYLLAPWVVGLLVAPGSHLREGEAFAQVVYLTRLLLPFLLGISLAALFSALLQAEERFLPYALGPVAFNLAAIGLMALFPGNPTALGLSVALGGLLQAAIQLPFLRGLRLEWRWHQAFAPALLRMGPFAFTTSLRQFLNLVLTNILTRYPPAAVTGFYNAEVVFQMVLGLFATSPAIALFPRMSALQGEELARFLEAPLKRLSLVLALLGGLLLGLSPYVVVLLFGLFGPLTPENRAYSAQVLAAMGLAVLPWGVNTLLLRGLYALGRVREAVWASAVVFLSNTLGYWLLRDGGLFLLNLATALAGWLGLALYLRLLRREGVEAPFLPGLLLKAFGAGLLAALPGLVLAGFWPAAQALKALSPLLLGGALGVGFFALAARFLGLPLRELLPRSLSGGSRGA
ncbi:MAG: murein biosynthesis integral membrane protein MurJ [Thermus sp.]|uniref:murein biosynthesis integral membrane protein MurJ n=1 Tax=Thermus sp. TaxID=275 RepID=UPI0025F241EA|nr:murein biosynthesis integral membrane protein MurJ [Thermus sp.]MCS6867558.1 murein biosynthesis integral membrane protein MurJ [Thermus sp.]MCS7217642.1 murein biosynthesis integral membrane protein MurJ [Thermus sp.]MCX7849367.1 murein biosynthesis integral membrane protein MurJ [Thermus sp.]MDW8017145.1 murein biosynthesis integral membrane protein MurJ [Thermus sp.]MDW8358656.1 murein biosynthesis integral membrane protein MurJ [Thermus sp.]